MSKQRVLFVFGTRPEAIKMAPLIRAMSVDENFEPIICLTSQHREMLDQVMDFFEIVAHHDLNIMQPGQNLIDVTVAALSGLARVIDLERPDLVMVQGDTNTVLAGALAAFYRRIPIAHLEAGLRSGLLNSPFPEEGNRVLVSRIANWHFAPTEGAASNLAKEGVNSGVEVVGNTVIDALLLGLEMLRARGTASIEQQFSGVNFDKRIILVTGHRRESFGSPFEQICEAIRTLATQFHDIEFVFPVHLNPNVQEPVNRILGGVDRVHLLDPLQYPSLIWLMQKSFMVITDSGGIQEEAPALGKPVLVTRDVTERQEGVDAGTAILVGTRCDRVVQEATRLLTDETAYSQMAKAINPYGDGKSSHRILNLLRHN